MLEPRILKRSTLVRKSRLTATPQSTCLQAFSHLSIKISTPGGRSTSYTILGISSQGSVEQTGTPQIVRRRSATGFWGVGASSMGCQPANSTGAFRRLSSGPWRLGTPPLPPLQSARLDDKIVPRKHTTSWISQHHPRTPSPNVITWSNSGKYRAAAC